jgi:uncharacterized SAM-binding protein YcdF (DUF218 family)
MAKLARNLFLLSFVGSVIGVAGLAAFAESVRNLSPKPGARADAIVVLTGDEERIATGMLLMVEGRARRLLVSGVHQATRMPTELKRRIQGGDSAREKLVRCCVDIGYEALNTSGNAEEARRWVAMHGFQSLIVVTSGYHMPRSAIEFARAMPGVKLIHYPVMASRSLRLDDWWKHWPTARLLAGEYVKFLGAAARMGVLRIVSPGGPTTETPRPGSVPGSGQPSAAARIGVGE